jgi:class 3 adenylate cyclase/tetratricopeptide (TPR) repeat protein
VAPSYTQRVALRKTVTVLFSDIADSTSFGEMLDPEAWQAVLARYFEEVRGVVERHGGQVEKFIGDAVVAVFGVPTAREDDALRALRAAVEIRDRLAALNDDFERDLGVTLRARTGVNTGEVVVSDGSNGPSLSGDTMNVAARLEQAAGSDEILIGAATRTLGGEAIVVEGLGPLPLKGKAEPVPAFRLAEVLAHTEALARRDDAPLVGRARDLAVVRGALARAVSGEECVLVTVVGPAGVGKSRLVRELLAETGDSARVLVGRCASYGEGVTFLPLAQALGPAVGPDVREGVLEALAGEEQAELVADRVAAALGAHQSGRPGEETFWAFRRLLGALARERPLVLVVDDIHWAEPSLLDLLEYVASFASGSPIALVCLARPELLEERPSWTAPRDNALVVPLAPLAEDEAGELVRRLEPGRHLADEDVRRVVDAAEGNPLFIEQLLALNTDTASELVVPPTIQALLAARLDQLEAGERTVLECAAIEGRAFRRSSVVELLPPSDGVDVGADLLSLARRQFIRPGRAGVPGDDAFVFVHGLVRDAAYAGTRKETRADLHRKLAEHLEGRPDAQVEVVGHHYAQAVRYRRELGRRDETTQELAQRAVDRLGTGARRALDRGDDRAAATLFDHAAELMPASDHSGLLLQIEYGRALAGAGELGRAREVFTGVHEGARRGRDAALERRAELGLLSLRAQTDPRFAMSELVAAAERAQLVFEAAGDERGLARSWFLLHWAQFRMGRYADSIDAAERVIEHSRTAGDSRELLRALGAIAMACLWGPMPVDEALRTCDELVERANGSRLVVAFVERVRGGLCSMTGAFEEGREHCRASVEIYEELGHPISAIGVASELSRVERQAGRFDVAEKLLRDARARLLELGDAAYVSWISAILALVLAHLGEDEEALEVARVCRERMQPDHAYAGIASRLAEATVLSGRGRDAEARVRADEALALVRRTDMLDVHGDTLVLLGKIESAPARVEEAITLYERKGDVVSAARARVAMS